MSNQGKLSRWVSTHWRWAELPKRAKCDIVKLWRQRYHFNASLSQRDEKLNKILRRYGRHDLQIIRLHNRNQVVAAREGVKQ